MARTIEIRQNQWQNMNSGTLGLWEKNNAAFKADEDRCMEPI